MKFKKRINLIKLNKTKKKTFIKTLIVSQRCKDAAYYTR